MKYLRVERSRLARLKPSIGIHVLDTDGDKRKRYDLTTNSEERFTCQLLPEYEMHYETYQFIQDDVGCWHNLLQSETKDPENYQWVPTLTLTAIDKNATEYSLRLSKLELELIGIPFLVEIAKHPGKVQTWEFHTERYNDHHWLTGELVNEIREK